MAFSLTDSLSKIFGSSKPKVGPLPTPIKPPDYSNLFSGKTPMNTAFQSLTKPAIPSFASAAPETSSAFVGPQPVPQVKTVTPPPAKKPVIPATQGNASAVFATPSGAKVDANGNLISAPPTQTPADSSQNASGDEKKPPVPTVPTEAEKAVERANKAVLESMQITPEELSTQEDIDKLIESTKTAYRNTSGQAIPLEFITGQLKSIEERATGLAEPLERKLARLQAQRTSSLESSKFALERADKKLTSERDAKKPISGTSFYDPTTGQFIQAPSKEAAEGFTLSPGEVRYDAQGNVIASGGPKPLTATQEAKIVADQEKATAAQQANSDTLNVVNNLLAGDVSKITGAGQNPLNYLSVTNQKSINEYTQLKAKLALGARQLIKGSGPVSDYEAKVLSDSTSALGRNLNNADFKQALLNIRGVLKTNAGQSAMVKVTDPATGKTKVGELTGQEIYDAVSQGYAVNYQ